MDELQNRLKLEESLKEGHRNGKWYARHSPESDVYCYAFNSNSPAYS